MLYNTLYAVIYHMICISYITHVMLYNTYVMLYNMIMLCYITNDCYVI